MAEDRDVGRQGEESLGATDPVAMALALGSASRSEADIFLRKQGALIDDQRHHLHEQLKQLHLGIWEKWLGVFLRAATAAVGLGAAAAVGLLVWQAAHSNSLLIEAFSVPPDLAAKGVTGEVVATKLLDHLVTMQLQTNSARPAKSYANSWDQHGIKLDIPETGISLSELDGWLRERLGHDTRVSGEIVHGAEGLNLTVRAGADGAQSVTGTEENLDALVQKLAEQVYRLTQPFRYGMYLSEHGRNEESLPLFAQLVRSGDKEDQLWAYNRWGAETMDLVNIDAGIRLLRQSIASNPDSIGSYDTLWGGLTEKSNPEEALQVERAQMARLSGHTQTYVAPERVAAMKQIIQERIDATNGAFHDAAPAVMDSIQLHYPGIGLGHLVFFILMPAQIGEHDGEAARASLADWTERFRTAPNPDDSYLIFRRSQWMAGRQDWQGILSQAGAIAANLASFPPNRFVFQTTTTPLMAQAEAQLGHFAAAEARIAATPADCYLCLQVRAKIAELQGQHARADFWFARADAAGPSIPFAAADWGVALLARGQPDAAIAKFGQANRITPHFADPLEGWGEALIAKSQSHLALAKFAEADKYAPNWGRLHLKWGEALAYSGKKDEAKAQFARAAQLDLTPSEKAELTTMTLGVPHG
ncbi:MAG TPA: hypothetical protein VFI23_08480 [Rhizomicrobium sp.]|nr:hypothetical protein [Rhizomicrobium sp.]